MQKTTTSSDLRAHVERVLNEVGYGGVQYVVEKFGEPTAAIVSIQDFRMLHEVRRRQAGDSLRGVLTALRARNKELDADEVDGLIEEARGEFYRVRIVEPDGH